MATDWVRNPCGAALLPLPPPLAPAPSLQLWMSLAAMGTWCLAEKHCPTARNWQGVSWPSLFLRWGKGLRTWEIEKNVFCFQAPYKFQEEEKVPIPSNLKFSLKEIDVRISREACWILFLRYCLNAPFIWHRVGIVLYNGIKRRFMSFQSGLRLTSFLSGHFSQDQWSTGSQCAKWLEHIRYDRIKILV